jgi:hypothetical protein
VRLRKDTRTTELAHLVDCESAGRKRLQDHPTATSKQRANALFRLIEGGTLDRVKAALIDEKATG